MSNQKMKQNTCHLFKILNIQFVAKIQTFLYYKIYPINISVLKVHIKKKKSNTVYESLIF